MSEPITIASFFPPPLVRILLAVVPIAVACYFAMGLHDQAPAPDTMTAAAVAARLQPVALVAMAPVAAATPSAAAPPAATAAPAANAAPAADAAPASSAATVATVAAASPASLQTGKAVYQSVCSACHGQGVAGAPKFGDRKAWAPRIAEGYAVLVKHAIEGYSGKAGVMPPKGGSSLEDVEVARGVAYMADKAGASFPEPSTLAKN
jgi:cytochrome c5